MKTIIHVSQPNIRKNIGREAEDMLPVITAKTYKENMYCNQADIVDNEGNAVASIVYSPDKPLSCGARLYIEVDSNNVVLHDAKQYKEIKE